MTPSAQAIWETGIDDVANDVVLTEAARWFGVFQSHYVQQNFGACVDAFLLALDVAPDAAFRHFMTRVSSALVRAAAYTRRNDEVAVALDSQFADYPLMHLLSDDDPLQIERLVALRESNIAKGLPSVAMIALGKSASSSVANIFNSGFNLPSFAYSLAANVVIESFARDFARGGACYCTHLEPNPVNVRRLKQASIEKVVVHVRDPRQVLLSMVHHVDRYSGQLPEYERSNFNKIPIEERLDELIGIYFHSIAWIQRWCEAEKELNILFSTFEAFTRDRTAFAKRYIAFYGHEERFSWDDVVNASGDMHFRLGRTDEWREVFPRALTDFLMSVTPPAMLERFGWSR